MVRIFRRSAAPPGNAQGEKTTLPTRPAPEPSAQHVDATGSLSVDLHPLESTDGMIVKVQPPKQPAVVHGYHVPCDIVLVIDVSGSMASAAPAPTNPGETKEDYGLSILDLVKHASRTILETLGKDDRLGIVTFSSDARVLQPLTFMDNPNKAKAKINIESMAPEDSTNLWHGILEGINLFHDTEPTGRVPSIMVLTDGMPNFMCPPQGYIPKLRAMEQLPATISTFGFGYSLRSGLLKSIAEISHGEYAFIPDAGMIGTVFVHAVANLQSTFANQAVLKLTCPSYLKLEETTGISVIKQEPVQFGEDDQFQRQLTIALGNIQYGQSRDIYLRYEQSPELRGAIKLALAGESQPEPPVVKAILSYNQLTNRSTTSADEIAGHRSITDFTTLSPAEIAYHKSRSLIVSFISSLFLIKENGELAMNWIAPIQESLKELIDSIPAAAPDVTQDPRNQSLMKDLCGEDPNGQISMACQPEFVKKWGIHYLPSLAGAHAHQVCNSFKDPGPLMYGSESPLFVICRTRLDLIFDSLPAPKPSRQTSYKGKIAMSRYYNASGPCFAGSARVALAAPTTTGVPEAGKTAGATDGGQTVRIGRLRAGMSVQTPTGSRKVVAVLKTRVRRADMCLVGGLMVTPWHPVSLDGSGWAFPAHLEHRPLRYTGSIYSVLLERGPDVDAHAIMVDGVWGVTLGHGLLDAAGSEDVRAHQFLGNHDLVSKSLASLPAGKGGVVLGGGIKRDPRSGLINGFKRAPLRFSRLSTPAMRKMAIYA